MGAILLSKGRGNMVLTPVLQAYTLLYDECTGMLFHYVVDTPIVPSRNETIEVDMAPSIAGCRCCGPKPMKPAPTDALPT